MFVVAQYILGGFLIAFALFLVVAVLMQSGKDKRLSGSIGGGTDTYYGQNKGKSRDKILSMLTTIIGAVFVVLVVVMYVLISRYYAG